MEDNKENKEIKESKHINEYSEKELEDKVNKNSKLMKQTFDILKTEISPLTPEIMSRQATINVGTIGHVAHGKTTVVKCISGVNTIRHKIEQQRRFTYNLGYANAKLYKCDTCKGESSYKSFGSEKEDELKCDKDCQGKLTLQRHISFVDCPGHDILMATMLNGAAVMDAALLLIAANEPCPQPQTSEHLAAVEKMNLKHIIILQNKIDIVVKDNKRESLAKEQFLQIKKFVKSTNAQNSSIIPISAQFKYNIDVVVEHLCKIPIPNRDFVSPPKFIVVRSFDINKPGTPLEEIKGGVAGGTLVRGVLRVGDDVEIRPGNVIRSNDEIKCSSLFTKITSLQAENNDLLFAVPGGLIGVGTNLDPYLTRKNNLVGRILGLPGKLPDIFIKIEVNVHLLTRLLGVKQKLGSKNPESVTDIKIEETLLLNVGSTSVGAKVRSISGGKSIISFDLISPVCAEIGEKIAISRRIEESFRLIGWGNVLKGVQVPNK